MTRGCRAAEAGPITEDYQDLHCAKSLARGSSTRMLQLMPPSSENTMPPQSRGDSPEGPSFMSSTSNLPSINSYLENLPSPTSTVSHQITPTGPLPNGVTERQTTTPTRLNHFDIPDEDEENADEDGNGEHGDVTLDDEEFQTHYSRHSSPASSSDASDDQDEENTSFTRPNSPTNLQRVTSLPASASPQQNGSHIHTSYSTTSLPRPPPPPPLYPPFYNRPPTPLPPSPSLTSLLRPPSLLTRSAHSTRAHSTRGTSPDSSDVETPNDTEAAVFHSAERAKPLPPTHPKVPTYEYYGFVLYLASSLTFALYILWSYLPSPFLHGMGLRYYPNRWWSLAIPAWIVMLLVFIYVALLSYNVEYLTLGMQSVECMVDDAANVAVLDDKGRARKGGSKRLAAEFEEERKRRLKGSWGRSGQRKGKGRKGSGGASVADVFGSGGYGLSTPRADVFSYGAAAQIPPDMNWRHTWNEGTDAVMDVPIGGVCEVLYGEG